jgi:hypothetical protein
MHPTLPIRDFGVMEEIYCGIRPELIPIIIPSINLPTKRGTKDR